MINYQSFRAPNLKIYVAQRVRNGEYSNASDYIRTLIRKDRELTQPAAPDIFPQLLEEATRIQALPLMPNIHLGCTVWVIQIVKCKNPC